MDEDLDHHVFEKVNSTGRGTTNSGQHHSKRQDMQTLVLQSKAEEDHRGQEIIIHLQFISKVTITTCTYTDIFPPFYVQYAISNCVPDVVCTLYTLQPCHSIIQGKTNKSQIFIYSYCTFS